MTVRKFFFMQIKPDTLLSNIFYRVYFLNNDYNILL